MDFVDYLWLKFGVLVALAFVWGLYCGFTGRPLGEERRDNQTEADRRPEGP